MALRTPTLPDNKEDQDKLYDPGEQAYKELVGGGHVSSGIDQAEAFINDPDNHDDTDGVGKAEQNPTDTPAGGFYHPSPEGQRQKFNVKNFLSKRGPIVGIISVLGVSGGLLAGIFGPSAMLVSLMENLTLTNDSSSTALERRFMKVFGNMTKSSDPVCANSSKSIKCKMGRISNKALGQLKARGVTPIFDGGTKNTDLKSGYPSKNPRAYSFDLGDGRVANVLAGDMPGYLANNPKVAAKILGRAGAFNLRVKAWTGKYISQKLFGKIAVNRAGGIADGENEKHPASQIASEALKRLRDKIPGLEGLQSAADGIKGKIEKQLGSAKKGGTGYVLAVAGCIGVKAPGYIAAAVAAVQLAQILPIAHDVILSPGSKVKVSGIDPANSVTSEDMDAAGSLLTNRYPRESDGKLSSALDSPYLLAALGVNKAKPAVSADYTPGFGVLKAVQPAIQAEAASRDACNVIMSPAAMYSALAVDSAVTVASSATVIGGIVKIVGSFAISEAAVKVATEVAGAVAKPLLVEVAKNDKIPKAHGEALGDVLGISASSFFASGAMARNVPGLKMSQLSDYASVQAENEKFQRDMDVASLSPFDLSSRYTFLGSIAHDFSTISLQSGTYGGGFLSQLLNLGRLPLASLSPSVGATSNFTSDYCDYAKDFGLVTQNAADTPAINMAGLPCTGITTTQANMPTSTALNLIKGQGWLDESKSVSDDATIPDLVDSGYIKSDTPLYDTIESCGNALSGDYLFNAAGCTTNSETKNVSAVSDSLSPEACEDDACDVDGVGSGSGSVDAQALEAIPVFLLDFQEAQSINGEDEEVSGSSNGDYVSPVAPGFELRDGFGPRPKRTAKSSTWHPGQDFGAPASDKSIYAFAAGTVESVGTSGTDTVRIKHSDGLVSVYLHMYTRDIVIKAGDTVTAGQKIGKEGCAGGKDVCSGPHLHFELDVSHVKDEFKSKYSKYPLNQGGAAPKNTRIDPLLFFKDQGVPGF